MSSPSPDAGTTAGRTTAGPDPLADRALVRRLMDSEQYDPSPESIDRFRQYGDPK